MKVLSKYALAAIMGVASASCPNKCSGHGNCGANSKCTCFSNWQGNDCADRMCPYSLAWVDTATASEDAHNYAECSNKGICDRKEGTCKCFPGYEGKACQRSECPNGCSGHGVCQYIEEMASPYAYVGEWDRSKTQGCVCDPYWTGTDCSSRMCPKGDDPLTTGQVDEVQQLSLTIPHREDKPAVDGEFKLSYTDNFGMTWDTRPIPFCAGVVCGGLAVPHASDNLITEVTLEPDQTSSVDDFYVDMKIVFIGDTVDTCTDGGTLHPITAYDATTKVVTFTTDAADINCGLGTRYRIVDTGTAAASDATTITLLGSSVADAYAGMAIALQSDGGCANYGSIISAYSTGKVATVGAAANGCSLDGAYSVIQAANPAIIKKALLDLPNEVIRDVDVSLGSVAVGATSLTADYLITFKNPANNNGRLLSVNNGGCNKAGCSPQYRGFINRGNYLATAVAGSGNTGTIGGVTVTGEDTCSFATARGSKVSNDLNSNVVATYVLTIADDSGVADTFTLTRNGGTATTALTIDGNAQTATGDTCGLKFAFTHTTGGVNGDTWTITVDNSQYTTGSVSSSVVGTKEAAECSNRGSCDGETGECKCFAGHTDEDCSIQSSLA